MAKKSSSNLKSLVIVESPAKARTIAKFLGSDFTVEASIGHVRDLPEGKKEVPEEFKKEEWAYLGVNVDKDFEPIYIVPPKKKEQVKKLKDLLKTSKDLYLATDEDREGEAISWHLHELLKPKVPVHRLVFHEITEEAIQEALKSPRQIDDALVKAQETRRILDRLYGYEVSSLLWRKVGRGLSAGRVQSVAVRLIVEREWARRAFVSATFWDLLGTFATAGAESFQAELMSVNGRKIPTGKDFDSTTGKLKDPNLMLMNEREALDLAERLKKATFKIVSIEDKPYTMKPAEPFITSTLQQESNRKLGYTARYTMDLAQSLYENGYITYMRTDSKNLAQVAIDAARDLVKEEYGNDYLPEKPRIYTSKVKNAQEAHEAIRPAGHPFKLPEAIRKDLSGDQFKLFQLIWKRTIASQMSDARGRRITIGIEGDGAYFQVSGKTIEFAGFLRAYVEGSDDPQAELADREVILPNVKIDEILSCNNLEGKSHTTQPPARFTEASLTQSLEEMGIGRPSTYASIIDTILARKYVFKKGNALVPTWTAFSVSRLMSEHLSTLVDYQFTAQMEDFLDSVSRREAEPAKYLNGFYFGDKAKDALSDVGLKKILAEKLKEVDARTIATFPLGTPENGEAAEPINVRVGKFGPYLEQGERRASLPDEMPPDELTLEKAVDLLSQSKTDDEPLGFDSETQKPVYLKLGRFGPYVQMGKPDDEEKPKNASLLKGMVPADVTLETALKLLSLPRNLGKHETLGEDIIAQNGRFGPYIKCGTETRSLPAGVSPIEVTRDEAIALLAQPKFQKRAAATPRAALKTFEASPVTTKPIQLFEGRYGPYITDGETNASVPRGQDPQAITFDEAVRLLAERAAAGPSKKKTASRGGGGRKKKTK
jgi:DNA topoisomerase I